MYYTNLVWAVVTQEKSHESPFTCSIKGSKQCVLLDSDFLLYLQNTLEKYSNVNVATMFKSFLKAI